MTITAKLNSITKMIKSCFELIFGPLGDILGDFQGEININGVSGSETGLILSELHKKNGFPYVLIVPEKKDVDKIINDLNFFLKGNSDLYTYFPPYNLLPFKSLSYHTETAAERIRLLHQMTTGQLPPFIITTSNTLMQRIIPKKELVDYTDIVMINEDIDLDAFISKLIAGGYTRTFLVEEPGDFSIRGGIVDLFSPVYKNPLRIELFGDMVESIRFFSVTSQRKIDSISEAIIVPAKESILKTDDLEDIIKRVRTQASLSGIPVSKVRDIVDRIKGEQSSADLESLLPIVYPELDTFFNYLPEKTIYILLKPDEIKNNILLFRDKAQQNYENVVKSKKLTVEPESLYLGWDKISDLLSNKKTLTFRDFSVTVADDNADRPVRSINYSIKDNITLSTELNNRTASENHLSPLVERINDQKSKNYITLITCSTKSQAERIKQLLMPYGMELPILEHVPDLTRSKGQVAICLGLLSSGFTWPEIKLSVITEDEIFGAKRRVKRSPGRKKNEGFLSFNELKEGDYVVHSEHGIGRYDSLEKIVLNGITNDYLKVEYKDSDKLYLPVDRMGMLQKYIGMDSYSPVLDKMGGKSWDKIKDKAKKEVEKIAGELLELYASRKVKNGFSFSSTDSYFRDFEAGFQFEETVDQLSAIDDVIKDMEDETAMDRLVCGDVGYGKTEVALRAAFKAVNDGKQVAVLVPTTVLAEQHLKTFTERFANYPVRVSGLSRFKTKAQQSLIIEDLSMGKVDIVIGTHRILSKDIEFKDLGLAVIDEEQRFGVKHKEQLKKMRSSVDVLTLTATPIPRTLHMSMTGIRDISVISTPPEERQAIITYVSEFDDIVLTESIRKELDRQGQIFFVHNNVKSIEKINEHLKKLVPEMRTGIAHGQMNERELEKAMMQFVNREIDMLVCTTIIESGLDIPAANTMFINRADRFGLSQIYQLRGRIGRSDEQAFAYLFIPEESTITRDARKRLRVLMEHSDLGAGFQIAMSDLQIRGGGAALGASQSGHIAAVGYEMFLKLMEDAIADMKGEPAKVELEPEINVSLSSFIPEEYVPSIDQRMILYRRLSGMKELKELSEIKDEVIERYGDMPVEATNILLKIMLKVMALKAGVKRLDIVGQQLVLYFSQIHQKNPHGIVDLITPEPDRFELTPDYVLKVKMPKGKVTSMVAQAKKILKEIAQHVNG